MQGQIKAVTQREMAQAYLAGLPTPTPSEPSTFFDAPKQLADADAAYQSATAQNQADWVHDEGQRAINEHYIDVRFGQQKQAIAEAKAKLDSAVNAWIATPRPDGRPQTDRRRRRCGSNSARTSNKTSSRRSSGTRRAGLRLTRSLHRDLLPPLPQRTIH